VNNKVNKIIGYWAKAMLHYRQPKGEEALKKLEELTDPDTVRAIKAISGISPGMGTVLGRLPFGFLRCKMIKKRLEKLAESVEE